MFNFFRKHLGKLALMTAAALWASCSDAKEEKTDKVVSENSNASQTDEFRSAINEISKKANTKYLPSREMDTAGVTVLYGCINCGKGRILDTVLDTSPKCLYGTYGSGKIASQPKGDVMIPEDADVEITGEISETKPLVLKAIRDRIPGLRHIFNKYRKKKQGFKQGKLVLKLEIGKLGIVSDVTVESTDTDYPEFDDAIIKAVNHWKFLRSKHIETVTIPFVFYERDESSSSK